jgi:long-chain acyl-CoA synthetase
MANEFAEKMNITGNHTPPGRKHLSDETILDVFWERVKKTPERPAILQKVAGEYRPVIWREHGRVVELIAGGLLKLDVQKEDKIAIMSNSRPQWTWSDIAILSCAGITVPIYPTLAAPEADYLLRHSDAVGVFVENERQLIKLLEIAKLPPKLRFIIMLEGEPPVGEDRVKVLKWEDALKDGEVFLPTHPKMLPERLKSIKPEDIATICYTSGTTGIPKGAMLSHANIFAVCESMSSHIGFAADELALSFLPLSHIYERVGGQFLAIHEGLVVAYAEQMETVAINMQEVRPTVINGVPRFYEKVYARIQSEVRKLPKPQQYLIRWAFALGKRAAKMKEATSNGAQELVQKIYKAELRVAERLVFSRIRRRFGGRLRFMVSGAAPLSPEVQLFFETLGITVIEGYGLTETAAPLALNTPLANKRGTVGRLLPRVEVKLAEDNEIMVRGPNVFVGYYKNEAATKEAFRDGWFLTGDIGEFDADGYLKIKDRKKDIIVTAGGKKIAPQYLENMYVGESLIGHILVYGDRRKYITALIAPSPDGLEAFAGRNSITYSSTEELVNHPLIQQEIQTLVNRKNQRLATFEQIKKFLVLDRDFSVEDNELTPTLKVKRKVITEKYKSLLDSMYETEDLEVEDMAEK